MKPAVSVLALLLIQDPACDHGTKGDSKAVDFDAVAKAHRDAAKAFAVRVGKAAFADGLDQPFDSGLPACRVRETRKVKVEQIPAALVGKRITFGPESKGDLWVVTKAKRWRDLSSGVPASRELAARLGVRCVPVSVKVLSATEVEIAEE